MALTAIDPLIASGNFDLSEFEEPVVECTDPDPDPGPDAGPDADPGPDPGRATDARLRRRVRRRRVRRWAMVVVVVLLLPVMWSYANALVGPGNDSFQARTVEWARDHHLGGVVDRVEKWWYDRHQTKVGGTPDAAAGPSVVTLVVGGTPPSLGTTIPPTPTQATPTQATPTTTGSARGASVVPAGQPGAPTTVVASTLPPGPKHLTPPESLVTPTAAPVAGEGTWSPLGPSVNGVQGAYFTAIRPDAVHTSVLDAVIWIDPTVLSLRQYPGLKIPGAPWDRPPYVEADRQPQLVAAFSGGFRLRDSHGGLLLGGRTLREMRTGGATFAIDENGMPNIGAWGTDISAAAPLDSARQNLDLIVIDGAPAPDLLTDPNKKWGFTGPANRTAVWRSGAGIRPDGSLIWVGGDGLTVETLAETLVRAGAIRGMQMEINREWVQLNTYAVGADGQVHGQRLLKGMQHTGDRWLTEDTRDFIAVFTR